MKDKINPYRRNLVRVHLIREDNRSSPQISNPEEALKVIGGAISSYDREVLVCAHLDSRNRVLALEEVSKGTLSSAPVNAREVFTAAILSKSSSILLYHNHPSGSELPSTDDERTTTLIKQAGQLLGIPLLDHLIIGSGGKYFSFKQERKI